MHTYSREVSAVGFNVRNGEGDSVGSLSFVDINGDSAVRLSSDFVELGGSLVEVNSNKFDLKGSTVKIADAVAKDEPVTKKQLDEIWDFQPL